MGFIDYIAEYFRGPQGEPGEQGPAGNGLTRTYATATAQAISGSAADSEELDVHPPSGGRVVSGGYRFVGATGDVVEVKSSHPTAGNSWSVVYENLNAAAVGDGIEVTILYYTEA